MKETKAERLARLLNDLVALGFTYAEAQRLRRISMTLHRWAEAECNGEIERTGEDGDGKPVRVVNASYGLRQYPIPDREAGARKQLDAIMAAHPTLWSYRQGDPRGCSLYVGSKAKLKSDRNEIVAKARSWGARITLVDFAAGSPDAYEVKEAPGLHKTEEAAARAYLAHRKASVPARNLLPLDQHYNTRGIAVCV